MAESETAAALRALFARLQLGFVRNFGEGSRDEDIVRPAYVHQQNRRGANIVTSAYDRQGRVDANTRHALLLDIDHPAWLIKSSTAGHYHLYIDVPDGIEHEKYMRLLGELAGCGVIEKGYANTSQVRGFTSLRFPWVRKEQASG